MLRALLLAELLLVNAKLPVPVWKIVPETLRMPRLEGVAPKLFAPAPDRVRVPETVSDSLPLAVPVVTVPPVQLLTPERVSVPRVTTVPPLIVKLPALPPIVAVV